MADNTQLNFTSGGDIISADQITTLNGVPVSTGEKMQRMKLDFGADGIATDVSISNPLPVYSASAALPTYASVTGGLMSAITATDIVTIYGSATKIINVLSITISGIQTTASQVLFILTNRSSVNTGGTSVVQINVPYDSLQPAGTATVRGYTVNPATLGAAVGNVNRDRSFVAGVGSATHANILEWRFTDSKNFVLRGTSEGLCINLNAETITGGVFNVRIEWTET